MQPDDQVNFVPGQTYENRKGLFEVVSLTGDEMEIRWDHGEQIKTSAELQRKILRNMAREMVAVTSRKGKGYRAPDWFGELFRGLRDEDFREDVEGTHWRSREQLGGAVSKGVQVREPFTSWAVYRRPEVLWTTQKRYSRCEMVFQSKFFARIWSEHILFGLYLERSREIADRREDWEAFVEWLKAPSNAGWLHETLATSNGFLGNPYPDQADQILYGTLTPVPEGFLYTWQQQRQCVAPTALAEFFGCLPEGKWINLVIARKVAKAEAVQAGAQFAKTVYDFFNLLLPVFESRPPGKSPR